MKMLFTFLLAFIVCLLSVAQSKQNLEHLFDKTLARKDIHNGFLLIHSDSLNLRMNLAKGKYSDGKPVSTSTPFLTTSIAKTFTATLVMMLAEEGKLTLDAPAADYLPPDMMKGLHVLEGVDYGPQITVSQLLQHRSGLPDYFGDSPRDGENMLGRILTEPEKFWTAEEIITFTKKHFQVHFVPGTGFHYSDTNYVLLGLIIERLCGQPLDTVLKDRIFTPLQMQNSSMYLRAEPDKASLQPAELYAGSYEISGYRSLSADWGGGGLLCTAQDLYRFFSALLSEKLYSATRLQSMQKWKDESLGTYYGYGLRKFELGELYPALSGLSLIGHSGTSSAFMYYCPELDTYLIGSFNQTDFYRDCHTLIADILLTLKSAL
jgi:CubicO group peptidase (beta-lactamase class C family)